MKTQLLKSLFPGALALAMAGTALAQPTIEEIDWTRPDTDFAQYNKILLKPLDIEDVIIKKPIWEQDNPEVWDFEPGVGEEIQAMFTKFITEEISGNEGYEIVSEPGPGVLTMEVEFLSLTPYTKPGSQSGDSGYEISTLGSGDVVLSAEFRDSQTGSLLVLVEGERIIGTEYRELSAENHTANLEETFREWGQRTREFLDIEHSK